MAIQNTGFKLATAVIENGSGVVAWTTPNNILLVDDEFAVSGGPTNVLTIGNFNHNIPQGATILNFTLRVKGYRGSFNTTLNLYAVDDTTGVELSYPYTPAFQGFNGTNTPYTLNPTLFATTWDIDQANNIKLKLIADGELHLDSAEIDISYDDGVTPDPDPDPSGEAVCDEYVQAQPFQLARAMTDSDLVAFLTSFNYPSPTGVGDPILLADFYGEPILTFDQGKPAEENIRITNIEHDYQGTGLVRLSFSDITNRGLMFKYPYTHNINQVYAHRGTAEVVISNNAPSNGQVLKRCNIGALVSAPVEVLQEEVSKTLPTTKFNFTGAGVTVTQNGLNSEQADIDIPGVGVTPPVVTDSGSSTSGNTQVNNLSVSNLVSSGVNRGLLVQIVTQENVTVTDVQYNGVSATQEVVEVDAANNIRVEQWFLVAPSVGTYDVEVTLSGVAYIVVGAETLTSVNQSVPIGATDTAANNSNAPSLTLTTTTDNSLVFDALGTAITPIAYTAGAGQSENWHQTANTDTRQGASSVQSAGTAPDNVVMSWAITQTTDWVMAAIEVNGTNNQTGVLSVTSSSSIIPINQTDPQNPIIGFSLSNLVTALLASATFIAGLVSNLINNNSFITGLTSNSLFQSLVNAFVTGGGGSGSSNNAFEDFLSATELTNGSGDLVQFFPYARFVNAGSAAGGVVTSEQAHPGIITFRESDGVLYLFTDNGDASRGGIALESDFELEIESRCVYNGSANQNEALYSIVGGSNCFVSVNGTSADNNLEYNILGTTGTTTIPVSNTWFKIRFVYESGTMNLYIDGVLIVSVTAAFGAAQGHLEISSLETGAGTMEIGVDYVNYEPRISSIGGTKKVGVGERSDIEWFNIQLPFIETDVAVPDALTHNLWERGNNVEGYFYSYVELNDTSDTSIRTYQPICLLAPDPDGSGPTVLSFNSSKQVIAQFNAGYSSQTAFQAGSQMGFFGAIASSALEDALYGTNTLRVAFVTDASGNLYGSVGTGAAFTDTAITGVTLTQVNVFRIEYDPGNATPQARFYVNSVLKATVTTNLPTAITTSIYFGAGGGDSGGGGINNHLLNIVSAPSFAVEI